MPETKRCADCGEEKPLSEFHRNKNSRDGLHAYCKACNARRSVEWQKAHPERNRELRRQSAMRVRNGLEPSDFDGLMEFQEGRCPICLRTPEPERRLDLDHCHETGRVRGLLCRSCNIALGYLGHDPARLLRAIEYLRRELPPGLRFVTEAGPSKRQREREAQRRKFAV